MSELKRNFSQAKMNKDMDERVLPPGQYRDANNVQVSTSDGSNVGSLQNLLGNSEVTTSVVPLQFCKCVGVLPLPEKDLIYYLVSGGGYPGFTPTTRKDYVIEYDTVTKTTKFVFVDIYAVTLAASANNNNTGENWFTIADAGVSTNTFGIRVGMSISGTFTNNTTSAVKTITVADNVLVTDIVKVAGGWKVYHDYLWSAGATNIAHTSGESIFFQSEGAERVLGFTHRTKIHSINHLDGMLFWTDGLTEPKKIHIERSMLGTGGTTIVNGWTDAQLKNHASNTTNAIANSIISLSANNANFHTRLVKRDRTVSYKLVMLRNGVLPVIANTEHITVIKKSPKFPLELGMATTGVDRTPDADSTNPNPPSNSLNSTPADAAGAAIQIKFRNAGAPLGDGEVFSTGKKLTSFYFANAVDFRVGDFVIMTNAIPVDRTSWAKDTALVTAKIVAAPGGAPNAIFTGPFTLSISSVSDLVTGVDEDWYIRLEDQPPLFEFKFPRFSYRYKYEDGEYSTFAPWTKAVFMPGEFDYDAKKGYNLGMTNRLRSLVLKNYFQEFEMVPADVVGIDLLYKEDGKPTVYTVKSLTERDGAPEWPDIKTSNHNRGKYVLKSEMIHAVVAANQMLRPWDNVPKSAKTQEMSSNRLIYGNYKQNYDLRTPILLDLDFDHEYTGNLQESVKTLRTYQIGVVFADKYGRETPVLVPKKASSITLPKKWAAYKSTLKAKLKYPSFPPSWAEYAKFYVKETSNEYYNLAQDRWYEAEDGNIWLSFPSAERNKVDSDTFLILKKEHDGNGVVTEDARYKILDISNDAPDYIKTKKVILGKSDIKQPTAGSTLSLAVNLFFEDSVNAGKWQDGFGKDFMTNQYPNIPTGDLFARIKASDSSTVVASRWVGVSSIKTGAAANEIVMKLDEPIGDTADQDAALTGSITYDIELRQDVVKHRPEFDGRFFVKVYKDLTLQEKILGASVDANTSLTVLRSHNLRMLIGVPNGSLTQSTFKHPTSSATSNTGSNAQQYHLGNYTSWTNGISNLFDGNTQRFGFCGARTRTNNWYKDMHHTGFSENTGVMWYLDGTPHKGNLNKSGTGHKNRENGVHPSHLGGVGTGDGCVEHTSSYSVLHLAIRRHYSTDWTPAAQSFHKDMTTAGTIFRFRDDPTLTAYKVIERRGWKRTYAFHYGTSCKKTPKKWGEKHMMNISFEKLVDGGPMNPNEWDVLSAYKHDHTENGSEIDVCEIDFDDNTEGNLSTNEPAIWETEPKEDVGLDIYYEASSSFPLNVTRKNNELLVPLGSTFRARSVAGDIHVDVDGEDIYYKVTAVNSTDNPDISTLTVSPALVDTLKHDGVINISRTDGSSIPLYVSKAAGNYAASAQVIGIVTGNSPTNVQGGNLQPWRAPHFFFQSLPWKNCYSFGNGIESDRVRDDFNAPQLANGVKASTVLATPYAEEHRSSGMIFSGIFNSTSGVNNLNQFIMAEPITKDLNPRHGTIQKLVSRDTNTVVFCEDKVLSVLTDKDALFNGDGSSNVTATNRVLGTPIAIPGDYGISTNPESLAVTSDSMYWCDQMRGQVLKLQGNSQISVISDVAMKDYFNDILKNVNEAIGTFDDKKNEYNLTLNSVSSKSQLTPLPITTISFNETTSGWTSFKSFNPEIGVSLNNEYYTFKDGSMWQHHHKALRNNFYNTQYFSDVTVIFNDQPGSVKSFGALNYEGTQSRITQFTTVGVGGTNYTDKEYYNLTAKNGWHVESLTTDLQEVGELEFKDKEGKWFSTVKGVSTTLANLDEREFSVQGIGSAVVANSGANARKFLLYIQPNPTNAAGTVNWDSAADRTAYYNITPKPGVGATTNPSSHTEQTTVAAGYREFTIDNNVGSPAIYSGLNLSAEDWSTDNGTASQTGSAWFTTYIYTADASWNADTGITKVEYSNNSRPGPGNTINVKVFWSSFTMPSTDKRMYFDVDLDANVVAPPVGNNNRLSSLVISHI
tara:strand:- start:13192 stop:19095 length:5904 start_codon:yes stop_codon:yes gene_type:complete